MEREFTESVNYIFRSSLWNKLMNEFSKEIFYYLYIFWWLYWRKQSIQPSTCCLSKSILLFGDPNLMKWSKLFHYSLFRCMYACTLGQKQYFLVFFCQVVYVGELTELKKERNVEWENMRQFSNWLHAVADKNGQLVAGMLQNYIFQAL